MNTNQKCALVTGASKGVGRGIAIGLAEAGWIVGVNYCADETGAAQTASIIQEAGGTCCVLQADIGDGKQVSEMLDRFLETFGRLDLMVNNAGVQPWSALLDLSEDDWDRTIRTNLKGTFLCSQQAARIMKDTGGCIINIGSGANKVPYPGLIDYCSSKGGIEQFTATAAVELGPHGIRVNCVAPGSIETDRTAKEDADYAGNWGALTPLRRIGHVEDVADAVVYLASERASFITGQTLYVDGGLWAQGPWLCSDRE